MDPRTNPYTPNAGARPPLLAGRNDQLDNFDLLLDRLRNGHPEQSMIITGLRGVGKTVLLNEFRIRTTAAKWAVVELEASKHDDTAFRRDVARECRRALFAISPPAAWKDLMKRAAGVLRSFTLTLGTDGSVTAGLNQPPIEGLADSGALDADLTDLLVSLGEAAADHETGIVFLIDEIQFLSKVQLEAVIAAIHKTVQRALPITMIAAGLPQIPELAGEAKSYAERLFKFPQIDTLSDDDADEALAAPARSHSATFSAKALDHIRAYTEGYPYFLQEYGKAVWDYAAGPEITESDAVAAQSLVEETLDTSFFRVRLDRTTELEKAYMRAMAELGSRPQLAADVAQLIGRTSQQAAPVRSRLIEKGLLYTPSYGYAAFSVPKFDEFLNRTMPSLEQPKRRKRNT